MSQDNIVVMEGVQIIFRNFRGQEKRFNPEGHRNFAVILDDETANAMAEDGWPVKWLDPRDEDLEEDPDLGKKPILPVTVKYGKGRPPRVVQITSRGRTNLTEDGVGDLDVVDIINVDLIVRPYHWNVNGKTGITAYLQSIYVTIEEDPLEKKYAELDAQESD